MKTTDHTASRTEWENRERRDFLTRNAPYHDTPAELAHWLDNSDLDEQIEWIENGTYGAGAALALKDAVATVKAHPRMNARANVGHVILRAFHGAPFTRWNKLPETTRTRFDAAVGAFLAREHDFAI